MSKEKWLNVAKSVTLLAMLCYLCAFVNTPVAHAAPVGIPEQSEEYKKGKALDDEKKYDEALQFFEAGTEKGDAWCMNALGEYYLSGKGGLQDDSRRALELINKAADLNLPEAYYNLACAYLGGSFRFSRLPLNKRKKLELMRVHTGGFLSIGYVSWLYGICDYGIPQDTERGLAFLKKAAELNNPDAVYDLSICYLFGMYGLPKNTRKGIELLTDVSNMFDSDARPVALNDLGLCYLFALFDVPGNINMGLGLRRSAAELNDPDALNSIGVYYLTGRFGFSIDTRKGIALVIKAAELNHPPALKGLGGYYLEGKYDLPKDTRKGIELMTKAAELMGPDALCNLGKNLLEGKDEIPKDEEKGIELLTRVAEMNNPEANYELGSYYENGTYVKQDFQTARAYYEKAKELGYEKATNRIYMLEHVPDMTVDMAQVWTTYNENEIAGDMNYQEKTVRMEGVVSAIGKDSEGNILVTFTEPVGISKITGKVFDAVKDTITDAITDTVKSGLNEMTGGLVPDSAFKREERPEAQPISVNCLFDKERMRDVAALKKGEGYIFQGEVKGLINGNVVLEHCRIISTN